MMAENHYELMKDINSQIQEAHAGFKNKTKPVSIHIVKLQNLKGTRDRPPTKERLIMGSQQQVTEA